MSILVVQLVPEGILLGADRNVTTRVQKGTLIASGQSPRPKVLKWPNHEIVVGYVGQAEIAGQPTDEWLYDFIGRNLDGELGDLAHELKAKLEFDLGSDAGAEALIVHLAGFQVDVQHEWKPAIWFIRNVRALNALGQPSDVAAAFDVSEEIDHPLRPYFQGKTGQEIRSSLEAFARDWRPFWFHQGYDLGTFNTLDDVLRAGMRAIVDGHPGKPHAFPDDLKEWSKHLKMAILAYGGYFEAFYEPFEQFVGGGADVVWAAWPGAPPL